MAPGANMHLHARVHTLVAIRLVPHKGHHVENLPHKVTHTWLTLASSHNSMGSLLPNALTPGHLL